MDLNFPNLSITHASCCGTNKIPVFIRAAPDTERACWHEKGAITCN